MKLNILPLIAIFFIAIERTFYAGYPLGVTLPSDYFAEDEVRPFLFIALLTFGIGYTLLALTVKVSKKQQILLLLIGLADFLFLNGSMLLVFIIVYIISSFVQEKYKEIVATLLLLVGLLFSAILVVMNLSSETFMDVAKFQQISEIMQSHRITDYLALSLKLPQVGLLLTGLFIWLPLLLLAPALSRIKRNYIAGILLFAGGLFIKTLAAATLSDVIFELAVTAGGALMAVGIWLIFIKKSAAMLAAAITIFLLDLSLLIIFSGIGFKLFKQLNIDDMRTLSLILAVIAALIYGLFAKLTSKKNMIND